MLTYGYAFPDTDNPFEAYSPNQVRLVTEHGVTIAGTVDDARQLTPPMPDRVPNAEAETMLEQLVQQIDSRLSRDREQYMSGEMLGGAVINLSVPDDADAQTILSQFLEHYTRGDGKWATGSQMIGALRLANGANDETTYYALDTEQAQELTEPQEQDYQTRRIGGVKDVDVLRRARRAGLNVLLTGSPGTGKTALCEAAFGDELVTVSCNDGMVLADLVGQWKPVPGAVGDFQWQDGPLVTAMQQGLPFLADDFSWSSTQVQAALLPVCDHRRTITIADRPDEQTITATDGFMVVLTQNPQEGIGITAPVRDRMAFEVQIESSLETAEKLGADPDLLAVAYRLQDHDNANQLEGGAAWTPSIRTLMSATSVQKIYGSEFAAAAFVADCPLADKEYRDWVRRLLAAQLSVKTVGDGLESH